MVVKPYLSYSDQVALLAGRGMDVGAVPDAVRMLRQANYYRLSGYWYPLRQPGPQGRTDTFRDGTRLVDVWAVHQFDSTLRAATFAALGQVEGFLRARLAHELGAIDPCAHLDPNLLGPQARGPQGTPAYERWRARYLQSVAESREDFVQHHRATKGGILPVWVAVEVLDWGSMTRLFGFAPRPQQDAIAAEFALNGPQLSSWLKSLNIVRNVCAHHGRLFNKVHAIKPKMPPRGNAPDLDAVRDRIVTVGADNTSGGEYSEHWFGERTFGQLTLIQHLLHTSNLNGQDTIPATLRTFPHTALIPESSTGAPPDWRSLTLWNP